MAKNNKTRFFYVLYSDKTWVFDQSERAYYPIYIINWSKEQHCLRLDNVLSCISVTVQRQEEVYIYSNLFDRENIEMK